MQIDFKTRSSRLHSSKLNKKKRRKTLHRPPVVSRASSTSNFLAKLSTESKLSSSKKILSRRKR